MNKNKILQKDYTLSSLYYQIKLPLDLEILIPADDPVRLLSAFVEEMELSDLYKTYGKIKKNQASPRQLFKIIIYASMNRIYSSRDIETACHRDINFMYLLEGKPVPDHATIARFISLHTLKRMRKKLYRIKKEEDISFVHGKGKRKTPLQRSIETLESYIQKLKEYIKKIHLCGTRNSYSKTDPDATFMRMKEDAMLNGQLKPAYNLQHGVDSEYITWIDISARPTDTGTLIPFLKDMEKHLSFRYQEIVADAGYESEENYLFLEKNGQSSFIKPMNYEISKTRKYKKDIGKMENMEYDPENDSYRCRNRKMLTVQYQRKQKTATGYLRTVTVYQCHECKGCPFKERCIKGNNCKTPMEKREKRLYVSKVMKQKREENIKRIISEYGTQLRMNRSIQAEGSFANVKEDMNFRRYLYRGKENVTAQSVILAIGYNINKLHHKIQNDRTGQHLFALKK